MKNKELIKNIPSSEKVIEWNEKETVLGSQTKADEAFEKAKQYADENKVAKEPGKGLSSTDFTNEEKNKLASLVNYVHPEKHTTDDITTNSNARFVTDLQISSWNEKETTDGAQGKADKALADSRQYTEEEYNRLNSVKLDSVELQNNELLFKANNLEKHRVTLPKALTELPIATNNTLGGIKIGAGLAVTEDGILSATGGGVADSVAWDNVVGKPERFTPMEHVHDDVTTNKNGFMTSADKIKLNGLQNYTHPVTHPASMITEDDTHKFVSNEQLTSFSDKYTKVETNNLLKRKIDNIELSGQDINFYADSVKKHSITLPEPKPHRHNKADIDGISILDSISQESVNNWNQSIKYIELVAGNLNDMKKSIYMKTSHLSQNLPRQCNTNDDKRGVVQFIKEDENTGYQIFLPISGTYKGRVFTRTNINNVWSEWQLVSNFNGEYNSLLHKPEIINALNSTSNTNILSAAQGKVLNDKITSLSTNNNTWNGLNTFRNIKAEKDDEAIRVEPRSRNKASFIGFHRDKNGRSAFIGHETSANDDLTIASDGANANINIKVKGTGKVRINNKEISTFSGAYQDLTAIPESFTPSQHTHTKSEITDLNIINNLSSDSQTDSLSAAQGKALNDRLTVTETKAHTHPYPNAINSINFDLINKWNKAFLFTGTAVGNANDLNELGFFKTRDNTLNLPSICDQAKDKWGIIQLLKENTGADIQIFYPVDGKYKGRFFTRAKTNGSWSNWNLISTFSGNYNDLSNKPTSFNPNIATTNVLGGVKVGDGLSVTEDGTLSLESSLNAQILTIDQKIDKEALSTDGSCDISGSNIKNGTLSVDKLTSRNSNPIIKLFDKCSIDATQSMGQGIGDAIRLKWDDNNYLRIGADGKIRFYINGRQAAYVDGSGIKSAQAINYEPINHLADLNSSPYLDFIENNLSNSICNNLENNQLSFITSNISNTDIGKQFVDTEGNCSLVSYITVLALALKEETNKRKELEKKVESLLKK